MEKDKVNSQTNLEREVEKSSDFGTPEFPAERILKHMEYLIKEDKKMREAWKNGFGYSLNSDND